MSRFAANPPPTDFVDLSDAVRQAQLADFLAAAPERRDVWVFACGSLIWRPGFVPAEARTATLPGYSRRFSFWTIRARGAPGNPGLGLALEPDGGSCQGVAFRLAAPTRDDDLAELWRREMFSGVYLPTWCAVECAGGTVEAVCFVGNRAHRNYAGYLPDDEAAAIIARAEGERGRCREYLDLLVAALEREGLEDAAMVRLRDLVDRHEAAGRQAAALP